MQYWLSAIWIISCYCIVIHDYNPSPIYCDVPGLLPLTPYEEVSVGIGILRFPAVLRFSVFWSVCHVDNTVLFLPLTEKKVLAPPWSHLGRRCQFRGWSRFFTPLKVAPKYCRGWSWVMYHEMVSLLFSVLAFSARISLVVLKLFAWAWSLSVLVALVGDPTSLASYNIFHVFMITYGLVIHILGYSACV